MSMLQNDYDAMRRTIYGEARNQSLEGQIAVAWVIKNRAAAPGWWGSTIESVCFKPWQFSCWNKNDPNLEKIRAASENSPAFIRASGVAALTLLGDLPDPTQGATSYHTIQAPVGTKLWPPDWAAKLEKTVVIGDHIFYRMPR